MECSVCFNTTGHKCLKCYKCKTSYHLICVETSVKLWTDSGKRPSTWKCVNCDDLTKSKCSVCHSDSKEETLRALTNELEEARRRIKELEDEIERGRWLAVPRKNKEHGRRYKQLQTTADTPISNSFQILQDIPIEPSTTTTAKPTPKTKQPAKKRKKVLFVTDSHGKQCGLTLQQELGDDFDASVISYPGAPFKHVAKAAVAFSKTLDPTGGDHIVVLAGTNNFTSPNRPPTDLDFSPLDDVPVSTNVHIVHVPFRYDNTRYNRNISKLNVRLESKIKHTHFNSVSLDNMNYRHHTKHGLHLNRIGKKLLCNLVAKSVKNCYVTLDNSDHYPPSTTTNSNNSPSTPQNLSTANICLDDFPPLTTSLHCKSNTTFLETPVSSVSLTKTSAA